ncbi:GTPase activating protein [Collariella sp. IMI 366227]|nr:GTPase activating protein [Collariella sp. IMI 366227]
MGNVSSVPDEGATLYLRDQNRSPGDLTPIDFVLDSDQSNPSAGPAFLLKLSNDDDIVFTFTFVIRRSQQIVQNPTTGADTVAVVDTQINGLTFVFASTPREVENLVTREFHADPNLHKNANVALVGTYGTEGSPSVTFEWTWRWKPPKNTEDRGGGWRNSCSFVEYDQRAHRLITLASFSFYVMNTSSIFSQPNSPTPPLLSAPPPKARAVSAHSLESQISTIPEHEEVVSPHTSGVSLANGLLPGPSAPKEPIKVDVSCPRPGDDMSMSDDGPVFRATMKALEQKTSNMRMQMKKLIKHGEHVYQAQQEANDAFARFLDALKDISSTNANAVQPAIEHYFDKIAREILMYERQNTVNLQKIVVDPVNRLYQMEIKQAESKKRDFEEESKEFYAYVSRYLGQRHDSVKAKQSDTKYQTKRKNFELRRFDYSSFMQDLSGGRKEQEILSHLTRFADAQARCFLGASKKIDGLLPQLQALSSEVQEADKEYQYQRREREEKRRLLEKSNLPYGEPEPPSTASGPSPALVHANGNPTTSETEISRADSTGSQLRQTRSVNAGTPAGAVDLSRSPGSLSLQVGSPVQNSKFKGIRDLEERDPNQTVLSDKEAPNRKEGLLWALNRPGGHVDPRSLNKQGWHKFWIVLDQGKLSEYSNWKQRLDLHMDPIDLRLASVREARNADRRFCFEVITPQFKRVYQATSEEDMSSWITAINNALQSAVEGRTFKDKPSTAHGDVGFNGMDIGSMLVGKSSSVGHASHAANAIPFRRTTVGARPSTSRGNSFEDKPDKLLQALRENDQGNCWCADCGSSNKVEWVSINLAIIVCIECSGIHRSLGTHVSKIRSLTLDTTSFTPDIVDLLLLVGNRVSNMVFEARLDPAYKLAPQANREQRLRFITAKYVDRVYVAPISPTLSPFATPDETLIASIKRNQIQQVIYALAVRANPNSTDKSRGTHAIYLALAAADPAQPQSALPPRHPTHRPHRPGPFPVAELLIQNGAEIPDAPPQFPLSVSAQRYIEMKRGRKAAMEASGSLTPPGQRDREARLQKRVSAGGRLAKTPIPER